jgi:hypothetical protein
LSLLERVVATLQESEIRFAVVGASALPTVGVSRSTLDLDLVVGKHRWQTRAVERARELPTSGLTLPVVLG